MSILTSCSYDVSDKLVVDDVRGWEEVYKEQNGERGDREAGR